MADLERLASVVTTAPEPELPESVTRLLSEARSQCRALGGLVRGPSDDSADTELTELVARAEGLVANMDPVGLPGVLQEAEGEALAALPSHKAAYPTYRLVRDALHRAAVGRLAPGLSTAERANLGEGWQVVKERAR